MRNARITAVTAFVTATFLFTGCGSAESDNAQDLQTTSRANDCRLLSNNYQAAGQVYENALLAPLTLEVQALATAKNGLLEMKTKKVSKKEAIERRENTARTKAVTYWQESFASLWPKITDPDLKLVTHELALKQNISANYKALDSICPGYDGN